MAAYLCAITADGGVPLFTRRTGDLKSLPFATIGTLNGVHMFSRLRGSELKSAITPEEKILWRVYHNCVVLILIARNDSCSDCHMANLLDNIFASMAMLVGIDNICNPGNIEKLKRELKACYTLIDYLLNQMDQDNMTVGDLTQKVDILLTYESQILQTYLDKFLDTADSAFGCLLIRGKIAVASKDWWTFTNQELILLSAFINSLPKSTSRDMPIYLPSTCPRACSRLLTLQLLRGVELCVLCSSTPSLSYLEEEAPKVWKGSFELLKMVSSLSPRNFPNNIFLDQNILGVILINTELNQCMCSMQPVDDDSLHQKGGKSANLLMRQEALRTLYKLVVGTYFTEETSPGNTKIEADNPFPGFSSSTSNQSKCQVLEFYFCAEQHKCYCIQSPPHQIYIIFKNEVPHYALRPVSHKTLKSLTTKKLAQWNSAA